MTPEEFERARDAYYRIAGCDPATGHPTKEKLASLGLDWVGAGRGCSPSTRCPTVFWSSIADR